MKEKLEATKGIYSHEYSCDKRSHINYIKTLANSF